MQDDGHSVGHGPCREGALDGTLIVEIGSRISVGVCGSLLSQLGARVVSIEPVTTQQDAGKWRHRNEFTAGKLSLQEHPVAHVQDSLVRDVVASGDALLVSSDVDGSGHGLPSAGLGADKVVCDITAYGRTGTLAGRPDSDWQVQAVSGIVDTTGMPDGAPVPVPSPIVEFMTGVYAAAATVAALRVSRASGVGQQIDMALYDCAFSAMATFLPRVLTGSREPIRRAGNRHAMIAPWNVYKARDGWVLMCVGSDTQWRRLCQIMKSDLSQAAKFEKTPDRLAHATEVDALVQSWVSEHTIDTCVEALNGAQIACGPIVRIDGYPREANLFHRGMVHRVLDPKQQQDVVLAGSPLRMSATSGRSPESIPAPDADREEIREVVTARRMSADRHHASNIKPAAALAGIRVIEIGHYTTVPLCTRVLASLGAEVIKIEPPEGEATRDWPPTQHGQGYFFTYMNSDKRSLVLDLAKPADVDVLRKLIGSADVLIENLKPGALARRGFSPAEVAALNPAVIYCSISGFGADSIYPGRPAYDGVVQAMSGLMHVLRSNGVPVKTGISAADLMGAEMGVLGVLAALAYRDRTGLGQYVDLSMQDITAWLTQTVWNTASPQHSPILRIPCRDGYVVAEVDAETLAQLPTSVSSIKELTKHEASQCLERSGIRTAPILTVHEMLAHPHTSARGLWFEAADGDHTWPLLASPLRLLGTPPRVRRPMAPLGRDTTAILDELHKPLVSSA